MWWTKIARLSLVGAFLTVGAPLVGTSSRVDTSPAKFKELMGNSKYAKGRDWKLRSRDTSELNVYAKMFHRDIRMLHGEKVNHIPHVAHVIWVGPKPFPPKSVKNMESFQRLHPDWTIYFWTDKPDRPLPISEMKRRLVTDDYFAPVLDMLKVSTNYGEQSDLMRFVILEKEGGIYFDHDALFVKSMSEFAAHYDLVAAFERIQYHEGIDTYLTPAVGLILARPHHPIFQQCIAMARSRWDAAAKRYADPKDWRRVIYRTYDSFAYLCKQFHSKDGSRDIILPPAYFYANMAFKKPFVKKLMKQGYIYALHGRELSWR